LVGRSRRCRASAQSRWPVRCHPSLISIDRPAHTDNQHDG
jgi:hypothetical protein